MNVREPPNANRKEGKGGARGSPGTEQSSRPLDGAIGRCRVRLTKHRAEGEHRSSCRRPNREPRKRCGVGFTLA
jgi:hypothetical protein